MTRPRGAARSVLLFLVLGSVAGISGFGRLRPAASASLTETPVAGVAIARDTARAVKHRARRRPSYPKPRAAVVATQPVDTPPAPQVVSGRAASKGSLALLDRLVPDTDKVFASAAGDTQPEPVILELRIDRLVSGTVPAYRVRTEALLPLSQVLSLAEVRFRLTPEGRLEATIDPGQRRLVVDARSDTMTFAGRAVRIEREFKLFKDGELYVGAERLGNLLGVRIIVNWTDLTASMVDADSLPIAMRARREAAREAFRLRAGEVPPDLAIGLERRRLDGLVLDYSYYAPGGQDLGSGSYNVRLGADAFGGSLVFGAHSFGPARSGDVEGEASWTGVWEQSRWVKQVQLGDGFGTGLYPTLVRGVSVTNAPFARPPVVGIARYPGRISPGWSIEAYQNGQIIAFDSTNAQGLFGVNLPVVYGENPVDFVAYGPLGEIRQFNQTYRILPDFLPAKRFEYGVSGGDCRELACDANANVDLHYGVSERWTVRAGMDQFWRSAGHTNLSQPYAQVTANPLNAWELDAVGVGNGLAQLAVQFEPSVNLRLTALGQKFDSHVQDPLITPPGRSSYWALNAFLRPLPGYGYFYLEGSLDQTAGDIGTFTRGRLGASVQSNEIRLLPYARFERQENGGGAATRRFAGVSTYLMPRPQLGPVLGPVLFRAGLETELFGNGGTGAFNSWFAFASRPIWRGVTLETGATWARGGQGATFLITLNTYLSAFRYAATAAVAPAGPATVSQLLQGSVLWNGTTGSVTTSPGPSIQRAGVAGRVFLDENLNGRYDPGEHGVPGVRVIVGSLVAVSDSSGAFRVWDLLPFEPMRVFVDSLSLDSPLLVPEFATATIIPAPNRFRTLDIPISPAGVIEGRVLRRVGGLSEAMPAITLILTSRKTGAKRRFATFSDGTFYLLGIKPGDYELTVDQRVLEGWQLRADPLRFSLGLTAEGVGKSGLELVLTPR